MAKLVSSWSNNGESMPEKYVFPPERRPGNTIVPACKTIPVIDLTCEDPAVLAQQILKASQDYGLFQVINHGVAESLMEDTMSLFKDFHTMPVEDKESFYSEDRNKECRLYTSGNFTRERFRLWRDTFIHSCHPLEEHIQFWPEKPAKYRKVVGAYSVEMRKFGFRILDLICEGLGLELGYFGEELSNNQTLMVHHYPPCPNPSLTWGFFGHCDPNLLTIIQQEVNGLQIFRDGQWMGVEPIPNAFVVNICYLLQVISNGKLKSVVHRVVTNSSAARTSVGTFFTPSPDCVVQPAKALLSASNRQLFRAFQFNEFLQTHLANIAATDTPYKHYSFQAQVMACEKEMQEK